MGAHEDARVIAVLLIGNEPEATPARIEAVVREMLNMRPDWKATLDVKRLVVEVAAMCATRIGEAKSLEDNTNHFVWLDKRKPNIKWAFWNRYQSLLRQKMPPRSLAETDRITDDILGRLEDPNRKGAWDRRGLVVGHVQSGKTGNYTGLICKAADAGYKVIVVLAGIHKSLRSQTQIRLDEGFLGYESNVQQGHKLVGVGTIDKSPVANTVTTRDDDGDFKLSVAKNAGINPGGAPLLFVVKKNASVLRNLMGWVKFVARHQDSQNRPVLGGVPLLVIDDEADHASVDTTQKVVDEDGKPNKDHDPATINGLIRSLLRSFEQSAYVGYTATPFANIFIHDAGFSDDEGADLFPRSFITNLSAPSDYFGPVRVFGIDADPEKGEEAVEGLPLIRHISDHALSLDELEEKGWMPPRHNKEHTPSTEGGEDLPRSLVSAIHAFVMVIGARRLRKQENQHNSMLVHVTRYTDVQTIVHEQVSKELKLVIRRLKRGEGAATKGVRKEMQDLWESDFVPTSAEMAAPALTWAELEPELLSAAESIKVKKINGTAADILDYEENRAKGLNVIAVGGDKLSRGLTLEGLSVSYFLRASKMYDTLMQMGRWFGYRHGYEDLCRLYMTAELEDWFRLITEASEELRQEFAHMVSVGATPKEYGLRVRRHDGLLITAPVKMRAGQDIDLSFEGSISETIVFHRDQKTLHANIDATSALLSGIGDATDSPTQKRAKRTVKWDGSKVWSDVPSSKIITFLESIRTHPRARRVNSALLAEYIQAQQKRPGELAGWTVALMNNSDKGAERVSIAGMNTGAFLRKWFSGRRTAKNQPRPADLSQPYPIRRLLSPRDEGIDIGDKEYQLALAATLSDWKAASELKSEPTIPSGLQLRKHRPKSRGLLLLYPLNPSEVDSKNKLPAIGFAVSFPASETATYIPYRVTNIYWDQHYNQQD
jgi:hypothetical protein